MARYWEWDAPFTIHPEETALLIIDMQTVSPRPTRRFRKSSAKERTNKHKEIQRLKIASDDYYLYLCKVTVCRTLNNRYYERFRLG